MNNYTCKLSDAPDGLYVMYQGLECEVTRTDDGKIVLIDQFGAHLFLASHDRDLEVEIVK